MSCYPRAAKATRDVEFNELLEKVLFVSLMDHTHMTSAVSGGRGSPKQEVGEVAWNIDCISVFSTKCGQEGPYTQTYCGRHMCMIPHLKQELFLVFCNGSPLYSSTGRTAAVREHVHAATTIPRVDRVRGRGPRRGRERRLAHQRHRPSQGFRSTHEGAQSLMLMLCSQWIGVAVSVRYLVSYVSPRKCLLSTCQWGSAWSRNPFIL